MKASFTSAVAVAVAITLGGCALNRSASGNPAGYFFAYQADNREELGLVQVFDDGVQTYLQLPAAGDRSTRILDEKGRVMTPIRNGAFLIIPGLHRTLTLERGDGVSHIRVQEKYVARRLAAGTRHSIPLRMTTPTLTPAAKPSAPPTRPLTAAVLNRTSKATGAAVVSTATTAGDANVDKTESVRQLQAAIVGLQVEMQALKTRVAEESAALSQARAAGDDALVQGKTFLVHFANNSARAEVSEQEVAAIAGAGANAGQLVIEGYTDAFYPDEAGANLARARARNVADILANYGMKRDVMNIGFQAAGGFACENMTNDGKAFNRRVAITIRPAEALASR